VDVCEAIVDRNSWNSTASSILGRFQAQVSRIRPKVLLDAVEMSGPSEGPGAQVRGRNTPTLVRKPARTRARRVLGSHVILMPALGDPGGRARVGIPIEPLTACG
jgi:hypothetical protein